MKKIIFLIGVFVILAQVLFGQTTYINSDQTWNTPATYGDIVIMPNNTLTIQFTTISMLPEATIFISYNAKLIVKYSTLTSAQSSNWGGIRLHSENLDGSKGELNTEYSTIENANIAVLLESDGKIVSGYTNIQNNEVGIKLELFNLNHDFDPYVHLQNVEFDNNLWEGVNIYSREGVIEITDCNFNDNYSGILFHGGEEFFSPAVTVSGCDFSNNDIGVNNFSTYNVNITDCDFDNNSKGIYGIFSKNINISGNSFLQDEIGIRFFESTFDINNGNQFTNCPIGIKAEAIFETSASLTIQDYNNFTGCGTGIELKNFSFYDNVLIEQNTFENNEIGIYSLDSKIAVRYYNIFDGCSYGIKAETTSGEQASIDISSYNYFTNCDTPIDLSGIDDTEGAVIDDNVFEYNTFGIDIFGSNHFDVVNNNMWSNDYNLLVNSTGAQENYLRCNELISHESGIQMHFENDYSTFIGNTFSEAGWSDVIIREGNIAPDIGSDESPALNYFSESGKDIELYGGQTQMFNYWLAPPPPPPGTDPENTGPYDIPLEWEKTSSGIEDLGCSIPIGTPTSPDDESISAYCDLLDRLDEDPDNEELKRRLIGMKLRVIRNYYYWYKAWYGHEGTTISWKDVENKLKEGCDRWFFQKKLFNLYLKVGECQKADSMLNVIELSLQLPEKGTRMDSLERESKQSFVTTQTIGLRYHCENPIFGIDSTIQYSDSIYTLLDSSFVFTQNEIDALYNEAIKNIPEAAFARALYHIATGNIIENNWYLSNAIGSQRLATSNQFSKKAIEIYPNPVSDKLYIDYTAKNNINGKLFIYDIIGKKVLSQSIDLIQNTHIDVDVSSFNNGIYMISIEDTEDNTIHTEKIIINKNN